MGLLARSVWMCGLQTSSLYRRASAAQRGKLTCPWGQKLTQEAAGTGTQACQPLAIRRLASGTQGDPARLSRVFCLQREAVPAQKCLSACFLLFCFYLPHLYFLSGAQGRKFDICPNTKCTLDFITYALANSSSARGHFL